MIPTARPRPRPASRVLFLLVAGAALAAPPLGAQDPVQQEILRRTGQSLSQEELLERLAESGMTRQEVRQRLRQMGLDPAMADPYFDRLEGREGGALPAPTSEFSQALEAMGLMGPGSEIPDSLAVDSVRLGRRDRATPVPRRNYLADSVLVVDSLPVFGRAVFDRSTTQFEPMRTGPVPPDYRLGPGDEVVLILTGDVELAYTLPVSREGAIVIPDVGSVFVNGLTLAMLEDRLYDRLGRVYSGVRRGPDASTRFQVSLGSLRINQVFVVGEVAYPGAYEVSSVATTLTALYRAGGPTGDGSFRHVRVRRGGRVVAEVDLYGYLLTGAVDDDVRLEQGDVVFVPVAGPQVAVVGEVARQAVYELRGDEGLLDVLSFAGGPEPEADLARVRIDRVVPPAQRVPGRERVVTRVDVVAAARADRDVPLADGDVVRVYAIGEEQRDRIAVEGFVRSPGIYDLTAGMTVREAVERAGGARPEAYEAVAHVSRLNPSDSTYSLLRVSLDGNTPGIPSAADLPLRDQDRVTVFGRSALLNRRTVQVIGEVKEPGEYLYQEGMTVEDLVLAAGGFTEGAQGLQAEVARLRVGVNRSDTVSTSFRVALDDRIPWGLSTRLDDGAGRESALPDAEEVELLEGDQVFIRELPGYVEPASVYLSGEVALPGPYAFTVREERLSSFVERAGGLTEDAYLPGARLIRDSTLVGIQLDEALSDPGSPTDVILKPRDRLEVPRYDGTVLVRGAVAFETRVIYQDGLDLEDYLGRAGGALEEADEDRISVLYQNGERATTKNTLWVERYPEVRPGSTVFVPYRTESEGTDWSGIITTTVSVLSATATLILAISRIN